MHYYSQKGQKLGKCTDCLLELQPEGPFKPRDLHSGSKTVTSGAEQVNLLVYAEKSPSQLAFINKYYINISVVSGRLCEDR